MNLLVSIANRAYDSALTLVYPQPCAVCDRSVESRHDGVVCAQCWDATPLCHEADTLCWKCGALSRASVDDDKRRGVRCRRCDADDYSAARACGPYEGGLRASILQLKQQPHVARRLIGLLRDVQLREPLNGTELIVPVPLHPSRERERGFNQALVLAREVARVSNLPLEEHSLIRCLHTPMHRAGMDAKARRDSVDGAFAVRHADLITGKRVLLIDDVFTTGATVSACAEALKQSGAEGVFVLTIARA
jgi:ComF family protein